MTGTQCPIIEKLASPETTLRTEVASIIAKHMNLEQVMDANDLDAGDEVLVYLGLLPVSPPMPPAKVQVLVDTLQFIANGCLVPPDGGSPDIGDAIEAAEKTLLEVKQYV